MRLPAVLKRLWMAIVPGNSTPAGGGGWFNVVAEPWGGAWQAGISNSGPREITSFSAVYACIGLIAGDIAKLRFRVVAEQDSGICVEVPRTNPHSAVLWKPNHFQTWMQFVLCWIISKLLYGNTYVLKRRDSRGIVNELYVLDATKVQPLVTVTGDVYYRLNRDDLQTLGEAIVVPASEIIHDLINPLWHPLVGVSPLYACATTAMMGASIQKNSNKFFTNMSRPSGALTAPGTISTETATRMKEDWEKNFSGENIGRLAVLGDGLTYAAMTIPANEAQLIEQLRWTVEDVARCYHVPLYKLGIQDSAKPSGLSLEALNQGYYSDCLQSIIEAMESCLDYGLSLPSTYYTDADLDGLLRMDTAARFEANSQAVKGGWMSPNEARRKENLPPVDGGDTPYLQEQNYSLAALDKRDKMENPFQAKTPEKPAAPPALPSPSEQDAQANAEALRGIFIKGLTADEAA